MNEVVNMFLLAGDKFMPEMHLMQSRFTYNACRPFTKNGEIRWISIWICFNGLKMF